MPGGRPSTYNPEIAADICGQLAVCTKALSAILSERDEYPSLPAFYRWMLDHSELRELYARAKDSQLKILSDEILEISDSTQPGEIRTIKPDGEEVKISDMIEHRKLRIDTRKWLLSKLDPKKYGDKTIHSGDPESPLAFTVRSILEEPEKEK